MSPVKKILALTAAAGATAALALPAFAATKTVKIGDDWFVRSAGGKSVKTVTISKGSTVKWTWSGKHKHQVFQIGGPGHFHSPPHTKRGTFKHKFTTKGTYKFVCPFQSMYMNVKVK
jgi:plastocyanin